MIEGSERVRKTRIAGSARLATALERMDRAGLGILLVTDQAGRLEGVITDGDVRRAILGRLDLDAPCREICNAAPLTAPAGTGHAALKAIMDRARDFYVNQIPLLDHAGRAVALVLRRDLDAAPAAAERRPAALIMAGGFGTRLRPLTDDTPKPMLEIGGRPLLETILLRLRQAGIERFYISTHFRADIIRAHFGDGAAFGVEITYLHESTPLGTAGAVSMIPELDTELIVVNGDVLSEVDFRALEEFHHAAGAEMTVAVREHELQVPFGVVETQGERMVALAEKPMQSFLVNAGMYMLGPEIAALVPPGEFFDMPDLVRLALERGAKVASFPVFERWIDIGRPDDYERAREIARAVAVPG